ISLYRVGHHQYTRGNMDPSLMPPSAPSPMIVPPKKPILFIVLTIVLGLLAVGATIFAVMTAIDANTKQQTIDAQVDQAVAEARKDQADQDEAKFAEQEKLPHRTFSGPEDFGSVSFDYPKTWSVFIEKDATSGSAYQAYLHPIAVPPVEAKQRFALRVIIENRDYDRVVAGYESAVRKGDVSSSTVKMGDQTGTRLDGILATDIRGAAVIFKIRDKTLTLRTDADTFKNDFDALVKTLAFKQ
ncbi:MAG TPA: hypothetical protein PLY16_00645, partial [Candidatus Saccharibacteria bacterium]|nr:hypothetical protein [Candidatus Saccharibacteria bacterium]